MTQMMCLCVKVMCVILWLADDEDSDTKTSTVTTVQQTTGKSVTSHVTTVMHSVCHQACTRHRCTVMHVTSMPLHWCTTTHVTPVPACYWCYSPLSPKSQVKLASILVWIVFPFLSVTDPVSVPSPPPISTPPIS